MVEAMLIREFSLYRRETCLANSIALRRIRHQPVKPGQPLIRSIREDAIDVVVDQLRVLAEI